ncbi:serine/threonine-protein kinase [Streptomyces indicus]|uniref:Peptidase inhibitor family I36 n=1 Tax=Streptomyces indicus TaxID=417292 RepID=A0A1G9EG66_9ACTN|nr:serine/threonine-protein kinase [Streptomyces indicus]SDK75025.1 Peptidase inhibitor family I36 [Streptomyces indicus]
MTGGSAGGGGGSGGGAPFAVTVPEGYRVGDWEVLGPLGTGSFGSVYAARHVGPEEAALPRRAALKFLSTGTGTPRRAAYLRELAAREVELLSRLRAPRLIRMYETLTVDDAGRPDLDGAAVLVLEEAATSLDALLDEGPPPDGPALLAGICEGLAQLHGAGWLHGDLKPANVLLMADRSVRLADFTMAAELEGTHAYAPAFSTPDYTPPELLWPEVGERGLQVRPSADIWAFGVLAHVVLTGTYPLPGGTPAVRRDAAVRYALGEEELRLSPHLPPEWAQLVTDCLSAGHRERAAFDAAGLAVRVRAIADTGRPGRRARVRRGPSRRTVWSSLAAAAVFAAAATVYALWPDPGVTYGYHRCPAGEVCFFSEFNGNGEMCHWAGDDEDWLTGRTRCPWSAEQPVKSVFNNNQERTEEIAIAYWRGPRFVPDATELKRRTDRAGCTDVNQQGNLKGDYKIRSHSWLPGCDEDQAFPRPTVTESNL